MSSPVKQVAGYEVPGVRNGQFELCFYSSCCLFTPYALSALMAYVYVLRSRCLQVFLHPTIEGCSVGVLFTYATRSPGIYLKVYHAPGRVLAELGPVASTSVCQHRARSTFLPSVLGLSAYPLPAPVVYTDITPWSLLLFADDMVLEVAPVDRFSEISTARTKLAKLASTLSLLLSVKDGG